MEQKIIYAKQEFRKFLRDREYTREERNKCTDLHVKNDIDRWNRLVKITSKEFERLFNF